MALPTNKEVLISSVLATEDLIYPNRFVKTNGKVAGAGEKVYGILTEKTLDTQMAPVVVMGEYAVESGATITAGDTLKSGALGVAIKDTDDTFGYIGTNSAAVALEGCTGSGILIKCRIPA